MPSVGQEVFYSCLKIILGDDFRIIGNVCDMTGEDTSIIPNGRLFSSNINGNFMQLS
jgi:hypothetical protein